MILEIIVLDTQAAAIIHLSNFGATGVVLGSSELLSENNLLEQLNLPTLGESQK